MTCSAFSHVQKGFAHGHRAHLPSPSVMESRHTIESNHFATGSFVDSFKAPMTAAPLGGRSNQIVKFHTANRTRLFVARALVGSTTTASTPSGPNIGRTTRATSASAGAVASSASGRDMSTNVLAGAEECGQ